jgi:predicted nucleic acid-binding protein
MSVINWGEVYYAVARAQGFAEASKTMERVRMLPLVLVGADESVTIRAARLKAGHGLPYADCFAAAIVTPDDVLVTADAKDFKKVPRLRILALPPHRG